jgi:hypothetical protein
MGKITQGRLNNAFSLFTGHQRWVEKNTGLTVDPRRDLFIQNPDGVLSNNRHFIADTQQEYQPNGDGTTEGQVIHILGYLHAFRRENCTQSQLDLKTTNPAKYLSIYIKDFVCFKWIFK